MQQRMQGTLAIWGEPFVATRIPYLYNLRTDPYERAEITSNTYWDWYLDRSSCSCRRRRSSVSSRDVRRVPAAMEAASFTIDQVQERLEAAISSGH